MAQSIFAAEATQFIDGIDQDYAPAGLWNLGVEFLGTTKAFARRCLGGFDVFGQATAGRPLLAADEITSAELVLNTTTVIGSGGWAATIERIARADWDYTSADWTRYRTGANWTAGGGDVAAPPTAVGFTSPSAGGEFVIAGMTAFVTDAIANRGGKALLRLRANNEEPSQSQWCAFTASLSSSLRPRLRITYVAAEPSPIDDPLRSIGAEHPSRTDRVALPDVPEAAERPEGVD